MYVHIHIHTHCTRQAGPLHPDTRHPRHTRNHEQALSHTLLGGARAPPAAPPLPPECGAPDTTVGQCNGVGCIAGCLHTPATYAPSHAMLPAAAASPRLASPYLSLRASQTPTTTPSGTCRRARRSACSADPTPDCSTLLAWLIDDVTTRPSTYWLMPSG